MFLNELAEPQIVVIYPGRFQPFHKGHAKVFQQLVGKFGRNNVYIVTSNKVADPKNAKEAGRYPFSFSEKAYLMQLSGVPEDRIVEASNPFQTKSVMASGRVSVLNPENAVIIFAVSQKDMQDNPETGEKPYFNFAPKKDGTPSYYQPLPKDIRETENMNVHGYVMTVPVYEFNVLGTPFTSATEVRQQYANSDEQARQQIIKDLFGNYTQEAEQIMNAKLTVTPPAMEEAPMLPNKAKLKKVKMPKMTMEGKMATPVDPKHTELIKKAKLAHPNASSDEEALALFVNDKEERDFGNVEREEQSIEAKVANLEKKFQQLDAKMRTIAQVRTQPVKEMGGVGVVKGGNDPRYCMATAGNQNDVNGKTLSKELRGFKLAEDRELFLKLRDELTK